MYGHTHAEGVCNAAPMYRMKGTVVYLRVSIETKFGKN